MDGKGFVDVGTELLLLDGIVCILSVASISTYTEQGNIVNHPPMSQLCVTFVIVYLMRRTRMQWRPSTFDVAIGKVAALRRVSAQDDLDFASASLGPLRRS